MYFYYNIRCSENILHVPKPRTILSQVLGIQRLSFGMNCHMNYVSRQLLQGLKREKKTELTALKVDDVTLTDDLEIAESMNSYFSTVFTPEDYGNFPAYSNVVDSKLSTILCNTNEVSRLLRNLNPHKSLGPDHLSPRVLKECAIEIGRR